MDCLFCKIVNKEIPAKIIHEDKDILVFLDISPTTNGDSLIIPKKHFENIMDIDEETLLKINSITKKLYPIYQESLNCEGLTLSTNTDYGQEIKHFHIHFIPRYKNDDIRYLSNKGILKDLMEIENQLKKYFN